MRDTLPVSALQTCPALVACGEQAPAPAGWGWSRPEQSSLPPRVWGWRASLGVVERRCVVFLSFPFLS